MSEPREPMPLGLKLFVTGLFIALLVGVYFGARADERAQHASQGTTVIRKAFELSAESAALVWSNERCYTRLEIQGRILVSPLDTSVCENLAISTQQIILVPSDAAAEPQDGLSRMPANGALKVRIVDSTGQALPYHPN